MKYIFVDPFNKANNGVSFYIEQAVLLTGYEVFKINDNETISEFRIRLQKFSTTISENTIFEIPETMGSSILIDNHFVKIHIRLHLSKVIGKIIQNINYLDEDFYFEQLALDKADFISAPSGLIVSLTKKYFKIDKEISIFPNPYTFNFSDFTNNKIYDFIFIGRWQKLKGIDYVEKCANLGFKVCVLTPDISLVKKNKNIEVFEGTKENKYKYLSLSKTLLFPSLLESFGYVPLEAYERHCNVLCSPFIGSNEYFNFKEFDFDKANFKVNEDKIDLDECKNINLFYLEGIKNSVDFLYVDFRKKRKEYKFMNSNKKFKKIKKFFKNPKLFFKDSFIFQKKQNIKPHLLLVEEPKKEKVVNSLPKPQNEEKIIFSKNKTVIPKITPSKIKANSLFIFDENEDFSFLFEKLKTHTDFSPFKNILKGYFSEDVFSLNSLSLLNNIELRNKQELDKIDLIFIFNGNDSLCEAIRSTSPNIKLVFVKTKELETPRNIDILISFSEENFPRNIVINNEEDLDLSIRRVFQENIFRDIDLLLPVYGKFDFQDNLINNKEKAIFYVSSLNHYGKTFKEILHNISLNTEKILLVESVFLKYKNFAEAIKTTEDIEALLSVLSYDSVHICFIKGEK